LIVDLRNNGGGALTDAVQISGLFLPGGPVVQVKDAHGSIRVLEDEDPAVDYDGEMIVLVNQFSASASEILAAALQDYGRAMVIGGAHTHGKGTVQAMMDLNRNLPLFQLQRYEDLGALKLTIQKFYRINGGSTQYKGVEPDLVVPSVADYLDTGEKYLDYSLPWDQVAPIDYRRWRGERLPIDQSRQVGERWVGNSEAFRKIKEETEKAKVRAKQTNVAVYLDGVWKERQDMERIRKEAKAAGLMPEGDEDGATPAEEKTLDQQAAADPYVQLAVHLLSSRNGQAISAVKGP
jgi:carboxyl-terminal processing protease